MMVGDNQSMVRMLAGTRDVYEVEHTEEIPFFPKSHNHLCSRITEQADEPQRAEE